MFACFCILCQTVQLNVFEGLNLAGRILNIWSLASDKLRLMAGDDTEMFAKGMRYLYLRIGTDK